MTPRHKRSGAPPVLKICPGCKAKLASAYAIKRHVCPDPAEPAEPRTPRHG